MRANVGRRKISKQPNERGNNASPKHMVLPIVSDEELGITSTNPVLKLEADEGRTRVAPYWKLVSIL